MFKVAIFRVWVVVQGLGAWFSCLWCRRCVCFVACLASVWFRKKRVEPCVFDFGTFYRVFDCVFEGLGFNGEVMGDVSEGMVALAVSKVWVVFSIRKGSRGVPLVTG